MGTRDKVSWAGQSQPMQRTGGGWGDGREAFQSGGGWVEEVIGNKWVERGR